MQVENNSVEKPSGKKRGKKIFFVILASLVILLILLILFLPTMLSTDGAQKMILSKVNSSIDGTAGFKDLSISWFRGIRLDEITFDSNGVSVAVKEITTKPHYAALLTGNVSLGETVIDTPYAMINVTALEKQQSQPSDATKTKKQPQQFVMPVNIINLKVNNGRVLLRSKDTADLELANIAAKVNLRPAGEESDLAVGMNIAHGGESTPVKIEANITPRDKTWNLDGVSGSVKAEVNELNLNSIQIFLALAGIKAQSSGTISADVQGQIKDGMVSEMTAQISGKDIDVNAPSLIAQRLRNKKFDITADLRQQKDSVVINKLAIESDWLRANAHGTVPKSFDSIAEFMNSEQNILTADMTLDLAGAITQMPDILPLQEGTKISSGVLTGHIETINQLPQKTLAADFIVKNFKGQMDGKTISLEPIEAKLAVGAAGDKFELKQATVTSSFAELVASGTAEKIDYNIKVDLSNFQEQLGQFLQLPYQFAGRAENQGQVNITGEQIKLIGSKKVTDITIASKTGRFTAPLITSDYRVAFLPKQHTINLDSVNMDTGFGKLAVTNSTVPAGKEMSSVELNLTVSELNLQKIQALASVFTKLPEGLQISGIAQSALKVTGKENIVHLKTDTARIDNLRLDYPNAEPFIQKQVTLDVDATANTEEKTYSLKSSITSPDIKIKIDAEKKNDKNQSIIEGNANLTYDWEKLSAMARPFLPVGLTVNGQRADQINFTSKFPINQNDKILENLNTAAKLGFDSAEFMGLNFGKTELDVQVSNGLMKIAPFTTQVNNGKLNFAATADFTAKPTLLKIPQPMHILDNIEINDKTTSQLLKYVNPIFANAVNAKGTADFDCNSMTIPLAAADKKLITVIGTVALQNVTLSPSDFLGQLLTLIGAGGGQDINIRPTPFALKDGVLAYDNMQVEIGSAPINFGGRVDLVNNQLNMQVALPYTIGGKTARVGEQTEDRISLPLTGTIDRPKLDTAKLLEQGLQQQLRKGLEGLFNK
ncbi:MAG: hypothetical protein PHF37_04315 [Phycisphaerae bacterium]|nr:hypothetical protein [Phycisphaerae bacterium]